jgi:ATP-binding cassette subfamily B protein
MRTQDEPRDETAEDREGLLARVLRSKRTERREDVLRAGIRKPPPPSEDVVPPGGFDGEPPRARSEDGAPPDELPEVEGALRLLRRGLRESPELRAGIGYTIGLAMAMTAGRLVVPILIQLILDRGVSPAHGLNAPFVLGAGGLAALAIVIVYAAGRGTYVRLVTASERALAGLRVRAFEHIHELSIAEQSEQKRGAFVARVTADVDVIGQFLEWGGISWITGTAVMVGTAVTMFVYSWQLALVALASVAPLFLVLRRMQRGMLSAYDLVRTRVGETLSAISESLMGAAVVRAYGLEEQTNHRLKDAIQRRYTAEMRGARYQATIFPVADLFGAFSVAAVVGAGAWFGRRWGLSFGDVVAFIFLVTIFVQPLSELSETFDLTQTAVAGWRKVLGVLDIPVDLVEPVPGVRLAQGPVPVRTEDLRFAYREGGGLVLRGISADIPAGAHVAIVGETGCGKTTFAKLLCRLADPTGGRIVVGDVDLREVAPESRRAAIRMVPQDGFLFDTTVRENVRMGHAGATDRDVDHAFESLGLSSWVATLPRGLDTPVGERGENLSVGERQLVALARSQLGGPGLLILDEATSAVDPETELVLATALERLSEGRTTVTIAHRMSTAEAAEDVLVFDRGRVVERGDHRSLLARGGVYAALYDSWLGNTREGS